MKLNEIDFAIAKRNLALLEKKQENNDLVIQFKNSKDEWIDAACNNLDFNYNGIIIGSICDYEMRIKPKPQYKPYSEVKDEWIGKKVIPLNENTSRINTITDIDLTMNEVAVYSHWKTMYNMFENYIWGNNGDENDGKPFGKN